MCEFLSFIVLADNGLSILAEPGMNDHSEIVRNQNLTGKNYNECEWTGEDAEDLDIRVSNIASQSNVDHIKEWILKQYKTRSKLVYHLLSVLDFSQDSCHIDSVPLTKLPPGLKLVGRDLDLSRTNVKRLPSGLLVRRSLYLQGTPIEKLPDNLTVGKSIDLQDCKGISELPKGLKFAQEFNGYLDIRGTGIKSLPDDLDSGPLGEIYADFKSPHPHLYTA